MQNYKNHHRYIPMYHFVLLGAVVLILIGSFVNLYQSWHDEERIYSASLICVISFVLLLYFFFIRIFPLKAQDRVIRMEENFRHFTLTGKQLDDRLNIRQIIALRFASDDEFVTLAKDAAEKKMKGTDIKKAIKSWKGDYYRV